MHNNKTASRYIIKFLTTKDKVKILYISRGGQKNVPEQKKKEKKSQIRITLNFSTMINYYDL